MTMNGFIHSEESFGTVDGPGIRYVLFLQGCPMRCLFCHNPDTWEIGIGKEVTPEQIIKRYQKNAAFYQKGGITVTGGEPLLQVDFLIDLFRLAKKEKIHTCIDTSGITYNEKNESYMEKLSALMEYTDLVMLDIKQINPEKHKKLTGHDLAPVLGFSKFLEKKKIPVWIRHIIVEGITDDPEDLENLGRYIGTLRNLRALDVLPYHTMGVNKYKELGIPYPLEGMPALDMKEALKAKQMILKGIHEVRG